MPLVGVICGFDNSYQSFDTCIECHEQGGCQRNCNVPVQLLKVMRDNHIFRKDAGISASTLLSCARSVIMQERYPYYEDVISGWNKARGEWVHSMIESDLSPREGLIRERRIKRTYMIDGEPLEITGKPDEVDTKRGLLVDYKSKYRLPKKLDPRHEAQFNIYIDLLADGIFVDTGEPIQLEIVGGGMHYVTWDTKYVSAFLKLAYPVWPPERRQTFIEERARPLIQYRNEEELPPCNAFVRYPGKWRCDCVKLQQQLEEVGKW